MSPLLLEDGDVSWKPSPPQRSYPEHQVERRRGKVCEREKVWGEKVWGEKVWGEKVWGEKVWGEKVEEGEDIDKCK